MGLMVILVLREFSLLIMSLFSLLQLANRQKHLAEERLRVRSDSHSLKCHTVVFIVPELKSPLCSLLFGFFSRRYGSSLSESEGSKPGRRHSHTIVSMTESDSPPQLPSPTRPLHPSSGKAPLTNVGESVGLHSVAKF